MSSISRSLSGPSFRGVKTKIILIAIVSFCFVGVTGAAFSECSAGPIAFVLSPERSGDVHCSTGMSMVSCAISASGMRMGR
ncbi:hypothetical protein [Parasutterella sp.]|uniref:hypothetical protein n=1 Tax=Parasutterella sp. TaxID=2049037 RepID=UPI00307BBB3B